MKAEKLKKGELFRVAGPKGIAPDIWIWEGPIEKIDGFLIRRARDNFSIVIKSEDEVFPIPSIEDL